MTKFNVGIIGCGNISGIYLKNLAQFPQSQVVAVADLDREKAEKQAKEFGVPNVCNVSELLSDPTIDGIVNLTIPAAHFDVSLSAVGAGKHVYNEKPLTLNRDDSAKLLAKAHHQNVLVGCAPDTVLGSGIQTARQILDSGLIGQPLHAQAFMMCGGHEGWHPSPKFYYEPGGGPLFDMGPYYLAALVTLLGPVKSVGAMHSISLQERVIGSQPLAGQRIHVETPTHISLIATFETGPIVQFTSSFDTFGEGGYPRIDIFGTEGILRVPDPNTFGGPVQVRKRGGEWEEVPLSRPYAENSRGVGMLDLLLASKSGRDPRASGQLGAHLVDVMQSALESGDSGHHIDISIPCTRPLAMPESELQD